MKMRNSNPRRAGATTVEVALVMSIFLMFLFGIFEYCRFLLMMHVATNAARDGARYAVVNVDKPTNFDVQDYNNGTATYPSIVRYVGSLLASNDKMIKSTTPTSYRNSSGSSMGALLCQVRVYPCDPTQMSLQPPVVAPKVGYPTIVAWNNAAFAERIAVEITGDYVPVLPTFLFMGNTIPFNATVTMGSEG